MTNYKGCPESNASWFRMLAHNTRGRCWWCGSRGWISPSVPLHFVDVRQTAVEGSLKERCLTHNTYETIHSHWKKMAPMTFTDTCWIFMDTKHGGVNESTVRWCVLHFSMVTVTLKKKPCSGWPCKLADYYQVTVCRTEMHWKWWSQCWNITKLEPGGSHECSHGNRKNAACKFVRTYWSNVRLKVTISCIVFYWWWDVVSSMQAGVRGMIMWIPSLETKLKTQLSAGKMMCTVLWDKKWMNLQDFLELG